MSELKLTSNEVKCFDVAFRRFNFNLDIIEQKYCHNTSGLVYAPHDDSFEFDSSLCQATSESDHLRAISAQQALFNANNFGSALLSVANPDAESSRRRQTYARKLNTLFVESCRSTTNVSTVFDKFGNSERSAVRSFVSAETPAADVGIKPDTAETKPYTVDIKPDTVEIKPDIITVRNNGPPVHDVLPTSSQRGTSLDVKEETMSSPTYLTRNFLKKLCANESGYDVKFLDATPKGNRSGRGGVRYPTRPVGRPRLLGRRNIRNVSDSNDDRHKHPVLMIAFVDGLRPIKWASKPPTVEGNRFIDKQKMHELR